MAQHAFEAPQQRNRAERRRDASYKKRAKRPSRRKSQNLEKHPQVPRLSLTPDEWCAANGYSRSFYEEIKRKGRGPDEVWEGRTRRITPEADAKWKAARTVVASGKSANSDTLP
jgi:hypothetical protein